MKFYCLSRLNDIILRSGSPTAFHNSGSPTAYKNSSLPSSYQNSSAPTSYQSTSAPTAYQNCSSPTPYQNIQLSPKILRIFDNNYKAVDSSSQYGNYSFKVLKFFLTCVNFCIKFYQLKKNSFWLPIFYPLVTLKFVDDGYIQLNKFYNDTRLRKDLSI